jgi:small subunit ribosomal protein S3Ae
MFLVYMLSPRKNGITYMCPAFSMCACPLLPPATRLLVRVSYVASNIFTEVSADSLRGRVFTVSLGELNNNAHELAWRKIKLQVEEIKGFDCYTNFHGMDITRDKLCSLVKKWHSLIEAFVQAKTLDGYLVRVFAIAFTRRHKSQVKATCYAKASQAKLLREKIMSILVGEAAKNTLKDLFKKLLTDQVAKQITKECQKIFPLENVLIRKVKVLKKPKFDLTKLMELYSDKPEAVKQEAVAAPETTNTLSA